jgi:hypothetical protein
MSPLRYAPVDMTESRYAPIYRLLILNF